MPMNYRGRGGGPSGRYYNNGGGYTGNARSSGQYHSNAQSGPPKQSPQKQKSSPPTKEAPPAPVSNPMKQEEPNLPTTEAEVNESASKVKKFTQRSRLFVGNMASEITEEEFKKLFEKYGEISETFVHASKGFGFVRLDTRANAEKAKLELDGFTLKGRDLKIRFASHGAALSLKHLSPYVSNELLEQAFQRFGPVERAVVITDDRGRSTGRGIVEFARKTSATKALNQISEGCYLLTASPQAIVAKPLEQEDTEDGLCEKNIHKTQQYQQEREAPPRFSAPGTFEHEFALRWKALDEMERQQQEQLNKSIASARLKLEAEMENAIHDHKTMLMKQELMRRQEELTRIEEQRKRDIERRKQLEYEREDQQKKEMEALVKRQQILRAQVEGTYPTGGDSGRSGRSMSSGYGGNPLRDTGLDYMAGGQAGLGPAPTTKDHSSKSCPMIAANMKKIVGGSSVIRRDKRFYDFLAKFEDVSSKKCRRKDCTEDRRFFSLLPTCPDMLSCQTLGSWKFEMFTCKINRMFAQRTLNKPRLVLYFLPIGPFPEFVQDFKIGESTLMEVLGTFLRSFFLGSVLKFLPEVDISDVPARKRHHKLSGKLQYHVSDFLVYLHKRLPADGFAIIGLSWYDLYPCENLNFILGQGSCYHSACVASFGRFDPNVLKGFKGRVDGISPEEMKDISRIDDDILWKLFKILSHETCHVLGLSHCTVFECLMNASGSSSEALSQPLYLCPLCMSKIQHLQIVLKTKAKMDETTVTSHLSSLHEFLGNILDNAADLHCEKLLTTRVWLQDMMCCLEE